MKENMPSVMQTGVVEKQAADSVPRNLSRAYVTFLAGDGGYVKGVLALAKGLRRVRSAYPLVVAVLPDVPEDHRRQLLLEGCTVREIEPVYPPDDRAQFAMAHYAINYSKLRIWQFEEYGKMVYLDADVQVYENIDELFDLPRGYVYAVADCSCEWPAGPQHPAGYCQYSPSRVPWPPEMGVPPPLYFNAGVIAFEPSKFTCASLIQTHEVAPVTHLAEQDLLNMYFKDVYKPIPLPYNFMVGILWNHPELAAGVSAKVVHYCARGSKPWSFSEKEKNMGREDIKMLEREWWVVYNEEGEGSENGVVPMANAAVERQFL
ncbi:unnamed protein product [Victoria cruziana]